jgi:hypothetical protein
MREPHPGQADGAGEGSVVLGAELARARSAELAHQQRGGGTSPLAHVRYDLDRGEFSLSELAASPLDHIVGSFIEQAMRQDPADRGRIISALTMDDFYTLMTFGRRCVVITLQEGSARAARAGLNGLSLIDLERVDWRDVTVAAALLSYAVGRSGSDARAVFRAASSAAGAQIAQILSRFADEPVSSLRPWGMREIGAADGIGLVDDDGEPYAPTADLRSISRAIARLVEADVWKIDQVTTGSAVAQAGLRKGDVSAEATVAALQRILACLSINGRMAEEASSTIPTQYLLIYVLQAGTDTDARMIAEAAAPGQSDGFAALSVRNGPLLAIMIARSVRAGVASYEHTGHWRGSPAACRPSWPTTPPGDSSRLEGNGQARMPTVRAIKHREPSQRASFAVSAHAAAGARRNHG